MTKSMKIGQRYIKNTVNSFFPDTLYYTPVIIRWSSCWICWWPFVCRRLITTRCPLQTWHYTCNAAWSKTV